MSYWQDADVFKAANGMIYGHWHDDTYPFRMNRDTLKFAIGREATTHGQNANITAVSNSRYERISGRVFVQAKGIALWNEPDSDEQWNRIYEQLNAWMPEENWLEYRVKNGVNLEWHEHPTLREFVDTPDAVEMHIADGVEDRFLLHLADVDDPRKMKREVPNGIGSTYDGLHRLWRPLLDVLGVNGNDKPYIWVKGKLNNATPEQIEKGRLPLWIDDGTSNAIPVNSVAEMNFYRQKEWGG